jgi:hypothetical protein
VDKKMKEEVIEDYDQQYECWNRTLNADPEHRVTLQLRIHPCIFVPDTVRWGSLSSALFFELSCEASEDCTGHNEGTTARKAEPELSNSVQAGYYFEPVYRYMHGRHCRGRRRSTEFTGSLQGDG